MALPLPPPTPTIDPNGPEVWRGQYYANVDLAGPIFFDEAVLDLNRDWARQLPLSGLPHDQWSVRWLRSLDFVMPDAYVFTITVDGGVRLYLDNTIRVNEWRMGDRRVITYSVSLSSGSHSLMVEYFDDGGRAASLSVDWAAQYTGWEGRYYNQPNFDGPVVIKRDDPDINFNWGLSSPAPEIRADDFSVDWQKWVYFASSANYRFTIDAEGGVRVVMDRKTKPIFDTLGDPRPAIHNTERFIEQGHHLVQVQYVDSGTAARIQFDVYKSRTSRGRRAPTPEP